MPVDRPGTDDAPKTGTVAPKTGGTGLNAWANALANALNIPVADAKARMAAYIKEKGGTAKQAANAVAGGYGGSGGSGDGSQVSGGGGGSSSTSEGSSGGSTGSSAAAAGPSPQQIQSAAASYLSILTGWGFPITPALQQLAAGAAKQGVSTALFVQQFRKTKAYARRFPGILKGDGSMRMTESQYISGYNTAKDYAATVGRGLTPAAYGMAIKNGNSPSEIKQKIEALDILKDKGPVFDQFSEYLQAKGLSKKPLTKGELVQFIMKQGPKAWEQEWQTANTAAALERFNVDVGKPATGSDLSYKELQKLQKGLLPGEEPDYTMLQQMADILPASELYRAGITKKMLTVDAFKKNPNVRAAVKRVLATATERFNESSQARGPQLQPGGGESVGPQLQASE